MRIVIFYQHIVREKNAVLSIAEKLRSCSHEVFIYSIDFEYMKAVKELSNGMFDVIVMPWMYHEKNYSLMAPFIEKNKDVLIYNLHSEQVYSELTKDVLLPNDKNSRNSIIHLVWGENFMNELINCGVNKNLIFITGNPRADFVNVKQFSKSDIASEYGYDTKKKWILFSDNRGWVLNKIDSHKKELMINGVAEKDFDTYAQITIESLTRTLNEFDELPDDFFEKYEIIYRPHPGTPAPAKINHRVRVNCDNSIYDWLHVVDMNIVWSSTTIFESDAMGIPSIVYEPIENLKKFKTVGIERYKKICKLSEINEELFSSALNFQYGKKIFMDYIGCTDGKNCENIAKLIDFLGTHIDEYKAGKVPVRRKYLLRRYVYEKVTYFFSISGLLKILKFPHSSYEHYTDLPWLFGKDIN